MTIKQQGQAAGLFGAVALFSALFCWFFIAGRFSHPAVWIQLVLGVAAAALPKLQRLGPWGIAGAGALLLLPALAAPAAGAAPLVATAWLTCAALAASSQN